MSTTFLSAILRAPKEVGAIWPSGPYLARRMAAMAQLEPGHTLAELGAGVGPITRELIQHDGPFLALEPDPQLAAACRQAVPGAEVVEALAQDLPALIAERGWTHADRVVSGLPFAIWSDALQDSIMDAVQQVLPSGGVFVTFTYAHSPWLPAGRRFRALLERRFGAVQTSSVVWRNVPPALVYAVRQP